MFEELGMLKMKGLIVCEKLKMKILILYEKLNMLKMKVLRQAYQKEADFTRKMS